MKNRLAPPLFLAENVRIGRPAGAGDNPLLERAGLTLNSGELALLRGPSGCGKSRFLLALARLWRMEGGRLELEGKPSSSFAPEAWRCRVCYVPQSPPALPGSVRETLLEPLRYRANLRRRAEEGADASPPLEPVLKALGLEKLDLNEEAAEHSGGEQARLAVAGALLLRPRILLLDEPAANLDEESTAKLLTAIGEFIRGGGAAVMAAHHPPVFDAVEGLAPRSYVIADGTVSEGPK